MSRVMIIKAVGSSTYQPVLTMISWIDFRGKQFSRTGLATTNQSNHGFSQTEKGMVEALSELLEPISTLPPPNHKAESNAAATSVSLYQVSQLVQLLDAQ